MSACNEDTVIKSDLLPGIDNINVFSVDTLTVNTQTFIIDTLNTSAEVSTLPIIHGLGTVNDPFFGKTHAGIYLQVVPPTNQFSFPGAIDSAFLILPYSGFKWGDTNSSIQRFNVYQTNDVLGASAVYYSNDVKAHGPAINLPYTVDLKNVDDNVVVLGASQKPHLRIPLNKSSSLLQQLPSATPGHATVADFINFLRGLYIEPDMNQDGKVIPYFFLDGANNYERAALQFFYTDTSVKSVFFNFLRSDCAHYNYIKRDANLQNLVNAANADGKTLLLQNEPGAAIDVRVPHVQNLPTSVVNKATLEFTQISLNTNDDAVYTAPSRLIPYVVDASGKISPLTEPLGTDGAARRFSIGGGLQVAQYQINIANTIQKAIAGKWNELHLRIIGARGFPAAYRLVAGGKNSDGITSFKPKITLYYSKPQ